MTELNGTGREPAEGGSMSSTCMVDFRAVLNSEFVSVEFQCTTVVNRVPGGIPHVLELLDMESTR